MTQGGDIRSDLHQLSLLMERFKSDPLVEMPELPELSESEYLLPGILEERAEYVQEFDRINTLDWDFPTLNDIHMSLEPYIIMPESTFYYLLPKLIIAVLNLRDQFPKADDTFDACCWRLLRPDFVEFARSKLSIEERKLIISIVKKFERAYFNFDQSKDAQKLEEKYFGQLPCE